jgi:hypothetical protein
MKSLTPANRKAPEVLTEFSGAFVMQRYETGLSAIRQRLADYWLNHAFLLGYQWTYAEEQTGVIRQAPDEPGREQAVINRIWPNCRTLVGKLTQREMPFEVPPEGADDGTIMGARIAESVLRSTARDHRWEEIREKLCWIILKGGTGAVAVDWDPNAGHVIVGPSVDSQEIKGGDTVETPLGLHQFVVQPGVRDAETAIWWIKAESLPPQTVQSIYGLAKRPAADMTAGTSSLQRKLISSANLGGSTGPGGATEQDLTLVLTYYERPNIDAPEGRIATVVGGHIIDGENPATGQKMPWPFPNKERLNLVVGRETVMEDEWTGQTILTAVRGPQSLLNVAWSSIIEHMKLAGNARLAVPASAIDLIKQFSDLPGEILPIPDGSSAPYYVQPAQLPGWLIDTPVNLTLQIDDLMGVHEVSRGIAPGQVESGLAVSILAEQDSTPVGRISKEIAHMFSRVATMVLELFEQEVTEKRKAVATESGQAPMTVSWSGKDLLGQTKAIVPLELILPRSRAAQLALAKEMMQMGLITSIEEFMAVAEMADQASILEKVSPDVARARRENHAFRAGRLVHPQDFDNHEVHIKEHNDLRKSRAYEMMTAAERRIVDLHIEAHATLGAEEAAEAQTRMDIGGPALAAAPTANQIPSLPEMDALMGQMAPSGDILPDEEIPLI